MSKITVLCYYDRIASFHTLRPFLTSRHRALFDFTNSEDYCLTKDRNKILVAIRLFMKPDRVDLDLMRKFRDKYERVIFFNDSAGGGIPRLEVLPFVDLLYNKALFVNRDHYTRSLYGTELFSDYYHTKYNVSDPAEKPRAVINDKKDFQKLRLSWNIGIGNFPRKTLQQRFAVFLARLIDLRVVPLFYKKAVTSRSPSASNSELYDVHARIGLVSRPSTAYQRQLILDRIAGDSRFLQGEVPQKQYNAEIRDSKIILSPFGWGELCFRDFEAVLSGALLLKPDMSHLETWPDVFVPNETYVPFSWDADDLVEKAETYLADEAERRRIAENAFDAYRGQVDKLEERFESIIAEIEGGKSRDSHRGGEVV